MKLSNHLLFVASFGLVLLGTFLYGLKTNDKVFNMEKTLGIIKPDAVAAKYSKLEVEWKVV